jgi:hypothetical protein
MNIEQLAEEWKLFKERQERVYQRNIHSKEYYEFKGSDNSYFDRCLYDLTVQKDMYENTLEGMLNWINDGRPSFDKAD